MRSSCCLTSVQLSSSSRPRSSRVARLSFSLMSPLMDDLDDLPSNGYHISIPVDGMSYLKQIKERSLQCMYVVSRIYISIEINQLRYLVFYVDIRLIHHFIFMAHQWTIRFLLQSFCSCILL